MGYVYKAPTLGLTFEGQFEGLEVDVLESDAEVYAHLRALGEKLPAYSVMRPGSVPDLAVVETNAALIRELGPLIVSWNLETEDGTPIPVSELGKQGLTLQLAILMSWIAALDFYAGITIGSVADDDEFDPSSIQMEVMGGSA